ncbi:hypothetical protein HY627_00760 [Candidatus Uhrbacteria bacterium]|nr:hypothetical protein [Candidatus Uhrbacteria bacterium]
MLNAFTLVMDVIATVGIVGCILYSNLREYWQRNWRGTNGAFFIGIDGQEHGHIVETTFTEAFSGKAFIVKFGGSKFRSTSCGYDRPERPWTVIAEQGPHQLMVSDPEGAGFVGISASELLKIANAPFETVRGIIDAALLKEEAMREVEILAGDVRNREYRLDCLESKAEAKDVRIKNLELTVNGLANGLKGIISAAEYQKETMGRSKHAQALRHHAEETLSNFGFESGIPAAR